MTRQPQTDASGVDDGFVDGGGAFCATPEPARAAVRAALGGPPAMPPPRIVTAGTAAALDGSAELLLEDGTAVVCEGALPPDLPCGYHRLRPRGGGEQQLLVAPPRCFAAPARLAGFAVQLATLRSQRNWGIGDLGDLRALGAWAAAHGIDVLLVSPHLATTPGRPPEPSPYYPSSRRFHSPLYLDVAAVPGAGEHAALAALAARGRDLAALPRIDHDAVLQCKLQALGALWAGGRDEPAFAAWAGAQGEGLDEFATFCALAEHHRRPWPQWPAEHRHPRAAGVAAFATAAADRVRFFAWLQWLLDDQRRGAAAVRPLITDLPVGFDPDGADAWAYQDLLAREVAIGAPPDAFNTLGQDWGLPPFAPARLREAGYRPWIDTVRACLRHAAGVRIDHVAGLFRQWWVPRGGGPGGGAYVRGDAAALLAVLAIESHRQRGFVVGEDLGTVEDAVRTALAQHGVLGYRVFWFEPEPPPRWPAATLAAVTTHDLPTIAGVCTGADLHEQRQLQLQPDAAQMDALRQRLGPLAGLADLDEVIVRVHALLAEAPSQVVLATLEDALGMTTRPNVPGTTSAQRANWSQPLPVSIERLDQHRLAARVARAIAACSPTSG